MKRTLFMNAILGSLLLGLGACSSTEDASDQDISPAPEHVDADEQEKQDKKDAKDIDELERKVATASKRLEIAQMELKVLEQKQANKLGHATVELEMAKAKLQNFEQVEGPNSLAQQKLNFQSSEERAAEAAEELAQIMIMYDEQDLNDMTREFVIARGKRSAARAEARLAIQASALKSFEEHELPTKKRRIELEVQKAEQALAQAELENQISMTNKQLSLEEAEHKLKSAQEDLDEAKAEES